MEVPIPTCSLVSLAIRHWEDRLANSGRETDLEGCEEEPCDDDNVSELGEDGQTVFRSEGTDGVAYVLSQLRDHGGRERGQDTDVLHYLMQYKFQADKGLQVPG